MLVIYTNKRHEFPSLNIASIKDCEKGLENLGITRDEINLAELHSERIILKSY